MNNTADHSEHHDPGDSSHEGHDHHAHHEAIFRRKFFVSLALSLPVLAYSPFIQDIFNFSAPSFSGSQYVLPVFAVIVFVYGGLPFLRMARSELNERQPGMMMLISLAITVAFTYSVAALSFPEQDTFFWELVTLIDVMLLGHWIEMRSVRKASGALSELAKLLPDTAERVTTNGTEEVPVSALENGDTVLIRPGASIPADGIVQEGESAVDESMITGESVPVDKMEGDEVIGGAVNAGNGSLRVEITATGDETALSGIMRLVQDAEEGETETQLLADKAAGWLFYIALGTAAITALAWTVAVGFGLPVIERMVTVLVIACPHALGLAIPLVVAINTSLAAQNGLLIRERTAIETVRELDTVMFDKTGTLTRGEQRVVDLTTSAEMDEDKALALMAAVEADSEHMIADAIRSSAQEQGLDVPDASGFEALKGRGVTANVEDITYHVGGPNLLNALDVEPPEELQKFRNDAGEQGRTVVFLVKDEEDVVAAAALADEIREESYETVQKLHERGIEVAMLTGDSEAVADSVAEELGIDTYFAEVLPEDKDAKVWDLQEHGATVAMVGDGVNDAPALVRADIGIAIGSGTDVAVESADVVLVRNDPSSVVHLLNLADLSRRKMVQNLFWAAGYNIVALPIAAGILTPWGINISPAIGAAIMSASTVIVAVNAQLMKRADITV